MRIGLFGGTFDPPHAAHVAVAKAAADHLELDEVLFVPTAKNPLKRRGDVSSVRDRLAMVEMVLVEDPRFGLCDLETTRGGVSYTSDTLAELQAVRPGEYWLIMGGDAFRSFADWHRPDRILRLCRLAVAVRPPHNETDLLSRVPEAYHEFVDFVPVAASDISSTAMREAIRRGKRTFSEIRPDVERYAKEHKLYL